MTIIHSVSAGASPAPQKTVSIFADMTAVLLAITAFLQELNSLELANASLMQEKSNREAQTNELFEQIENSNTDPYTDANNPLHAQAVALNLHNTIYQLENKQGDAQELSAQYQDENSRNQSLVKQLDAVYQQWQAATNQDNNNQQPILAVGGAVVQFIANFLRFIHN